MLKQYGYDHLHGFGIFNPTKTFCNNMLMVQMNTCLLWKNGTRILALQTLLILPYFIISHTRLYLISLTAYSNLSMTLCSNHSTQEPFKI